MTDITVTDNNDGYSYTVTDDNGYKIGTLMLDSEGVWSAQALNADYQHFETGTDEERKAAAIEWVKESAR